MIMKSSLMMIPSVTSTSEARGTINEKSSTLNKDSKSSLIKLKVIKSKSLIKIKMKKSKLKSLLQTGKNTEANYQDSY